LSEFGAELPFPDTENPAEAGLLIGNCRPGQDLQHSTNGVTVAAVE